MRRSALVTAAVLGGLVCLLGGTVLFSALQDTARTGTNSAESAALAESVNIQLAPATFSDTNGVVCGTFSEDDLTSGLFSATGVSPGYLSDEFFCIKNLGSRLVVLRAQADELIDVDFACTGDEAANGDSTCGKDQLGNDQAGELSSVLKVIHSTVTCGDGSPETSGNEETLKNYTMLQQQEFGTLAGGATGCFGVRLSYPPLTAASAIEKAQSDRATWRFKFSAGMQ